MLDFLIPISKNHSIERCIVSMYLPQEIINIKGLFDKLNLDKHFSSNYQRRIVLQTKTFNVKTDNNGFEINENNDDVVAGFIFEQFNKNGELENSIRLQNENNKSFINFETRNYIRWENFINNFLVDFNSLIKHNEFYFEALNLTYIDEFIWTSNEKIPVTEIFKIDSELINSKFINSKNGTIIILSQEEDLNVEERTELSFNNEVKSIQIIHQYANKFKKNIESKDLIASDLLIKSLNIAHLSNKEMLSSLLTEQVKNHIKLI